MEHTKKAAVPHQVWTDGLASQFKNKFVQALRP